MTKVLKHLLAACTLVPAMANAALVSTDLFATGDGLLTHDTETGLYWLDWSETYGLSYNDIVAGVGDWLANGFRYATLAETEAMFLGSAGFPSVGGAASSAPEYLSAAQSFAQLFSSSCGSTHSAECNLSAVFSDGTNGYASFVHAWPDGNPTNAFANIQPWSGTDPDAGGWIVWDFDSTGSTMGHVLVADTFPTPVPVPAAFWLFGTALAATAAIRRKRK